MAHLKKIQIARFEPESSGVGTSVTSGQSYEASTIVNYESRGEPDLKIPHITTLDSFITSVNCL